MSVLAPFRNNHLDWEAWKFKSQEHFCALNMCMQTFGCLDIEKMMENEKQWGNFLSGNFPEFFAWTDVEVTCYDKSHQEGYVT